MAGEAGCELVLYGYMGEGTAGAVNDEKALGKKLQTARQKAGLTQQELCQKASLSYSTLAKIERGAIKAPSVFTVAAIAAATDTTIEKLLDLPQFGQAGTKKTSKTGVKFVYFDVNGTLARFYEKAFTQIAHETGMPAEVLETIFLHYDGAACRGTMTNEEVEKILARELGLEQFSWEKCYLANIEPTPGMAGLLQELSQHYSVGLLTNNWRGFTAKLMESGAIPKIDYAAVIESAEVGCSKPEAQIYELAAQKAGLKPSEILLVDDKLTYLAAAEKSGWHTLHFNELEPATSIAAINQYLAF